MKIISKKQASKIELIPQHGSKHNPSPITKKLSADWFKVGSFLLVKKEDYNLKTGFGAYIQQSFRLSRSKKKFSIRRLCDLSGWLVERIK